MLEYIYICRHGFRANWVDPLIKSSPTGMNRDPPLAVYGEEQAAILGTFLSEPASTAPYPPPEIVFSSPFYRCIQSALPTAQTLGKQVLLEHGVQEWYSPVIPDTGLHPRPSLAPKLATLFPPESVSTSYTSTVYPSRRGESLADIHERAELFVEAWVGRVESEYPEVKSVVIFAHAASLIALGRALTADRELDVVAGCASTSLYKRNPATSFVSSNTSSSPPPSSSSSLPSFAAPACGVGEWTIEWNGRADYLPNGLERNWSFRDVILKPDGEVISDKGDSVHHEVLEEWPEGLAQGMERFLRRGTPPFDPRGQSQQVAKM